MKGQGIKKRKRKGIPGVQGTGIYEQVIVQKGNIFLIAVAGLFSLCTLFSIAIFVWLWKFFGR